MAIGTPPPRMGASKSRFARGLPRGTGGPPCDALEAGCLSRQEAAIPIFPSPLPLDTYLFVRTINGPDLFF